MSKFTLTLQAPAIHEVEVVIEAASLEAAFSAFRDRESDQFDEEDWQFCHEATHAYGLLPHVFCSGIADESGQFHSSSPNDGAFIEVLDGRSYPLHMHAYQFTNFVARHHPEIYDMINSRCRPVFAVTREEMAHPEKFGGVFRLDSNGAG